MCTNTRRHAGTRLEGVLGEPMASYLSLVLEWFDKHRKAPDSHSVYYTTILAPPCPKIDCQLSQNGRRNLDSFDK